MSYIGAHGGHGILSDGDVPELKAATQRIYGLMKDGAWHTYDEIFEASGGQRECLRRMRDLRKMRGMTLERKKLPESRMFLYRLRSRPMPVQGELF